MGETGDADGLNREQAVEQDVSEIAQKVPREEITANGERLVQVDFEAYEFADLRIKVQFPDVYPEEACRLEVSSKTLPHELVHKLRSTAESRASTQASEKKRHVADVVEYLRNALKTNRLAPAYEEVRSITAALPKECIQMQQKAGDIRVSLESRGYFLSFKLNVPSDYPMSKPKFEILKHNFPKELIANFEGQANEIAKKYEEGNLTVDETRMQQQARPSGTSANLGPSAAAGSPSSPSTGDRISVPLGPATRDDSSQKANQVQHPDTGRPPKYSVAAIVKYLKEECVDKLTLQKCPACDKSILPTDPKHADKIPEKQKPEYLYCGTWYHYSCLEHYIKSPPFKGGKTCLECGRKIVHPKFNTNEKELERKWQQKQARRKEVEETKDAMGL